MTNDGLPPEILERNAASLAKVAASYYHALKERGVPEDAAIDFTCTWIASITGIAYDETEQG